MRALIIVNSFSKNKSYLNSIDRYQEELEIKGIEYDVVKTSSFPVIINKANNLNSIYDFCIFLDKDKYVSNLIEQSGIPVFNSPESIEICDDKMLTHTYLNKFNIPQPKTVPGVLCYTKETKYPLDSIKKIEQELGYPMVVKECYGSLGSGVYLVNNRKELRKLADKLIYVPHLFQQFIKTSFGRDYRVIVIGDKAVAWMERISKTDFRSNVELGGKAIKCDILDSYLELAVKVAKSIGLDYAGVDILVGENDEPLICEVNSNAFFNAMEKITDVNIPELYIEHILNKIKK